MSAQQKDGKLKLPRGHEAVKGVDLAEAEARIDLLEKQMKDLLHLVGHLQKQLGSVDRRTSGLIVMGGRRE